LNGTTETPSFVYIGQNGQAVSIQTVELESSASCTYNGTLSQAGQMGSVTGNFTCSTGATGAFTFFEMQINPQGITGRLALNYSVPQGCTSTGWFGGIRGSTF